MVQYIDEVAKQISEAKNEKGFLISKLPSNIRIVLQTQKSKYEIENIEKENAIITGGTMPDGSVRFWKPTQITLIGSSWGGTMMRLNWIGKNMRFEFIEQKTKSHFLTSLVLGAAIESFDHKWCFILDW